MEELDKAVKKRFETYHFPGHDYKHVKRVSALARQIAQSEGYDEEEAAITGLLHDVGRTVKHPTKSHAHEGVPIARQLLDAHTTLPEETKQRILKAIEVHSDEYTKGQLNNILQDADKLDGMGAMGIARAYKSYPELPDYDPLDILPDGVVYESYKNTHQLLVFLLTWYDMLYTKKAREIGKPRHKFFKQFLKRITEEIHESK